MSLAATAPRWVNVRSPDHDASLGLDVHGKAYLSSAASFCFDAWQLEVCPNGQVSLRSSEGRYLSAWDAPRVCLRQQRTVLELWNMQAAGDNVLLQSNHGSYLCTTDGKALSLQPEQKHQWQITLSASGWLEVIEGAVPATPAGGRTGVEQVKEELLAAFLSCSALDGLLQIEGLGTLLLRYAAEEPARAPAPGSLSRGLKLLQEGKTADALRFFSAQATAQRSPGSHSAAKAALELLCRLKLGQKDVLSATVTKAVAVQRISDGQQQGLPHPAQHLAYALALSKHAKATNFADVALQGRAVANALLYLVHPDAAQLPAALSQQAYSILASGTSVLRAVLSGEDVENPDDSDAEGDPSGSGREPSPEELRRQAAWQARADKTPSFSKMLKLTGLNPIKQTLCELANLVDLDKLRNVPLGQKQYSACFLGNPGTGKTTVARIYAEFLKELGLLPDAKFVETSGVKLVLGGVDELKKHLKTLETGGLLFVDEAYQLNPKADPNGAQVLDFLLPEMEDQRGKLVVVFAGYSKQMEDLMAYNEGLPSRFPLTFNFPDYTDEELYSIFEGELDSLSSQFGFHVEDDKYVRIAAARLGRQRDTPGFGNARDVRNQVQRVRDRQATRVADERECGKNPDLFLISRDDLLGPKFLDASKCRAIAELMAMQGLQSIKDQVQSLLSLIHTNAELEDQGRPLKDLCLNRVLVGNPGTGKTTVAKLYGQILKELGMLTKGDVVVKVPADFIGNVLGDSEQKTLSILQATVGCVLVIDEAYGLYGGSSGTSGGDMYKNAVIDTIVAKVQGRPGEDRAVLLLGYEAEMEQMMRGANPGLQRRFQWKAPWRFEDFGESDLRKVMINAAKTRYDWRLGEQELSAGLRVLEAERRKPNFGNAGAVNNLLSLVAERMENRLRKQGLTPAERAQAQPTAADFDPPKPQVNVFGDLVGCSDVLNQLQKWKATIKTCQRLGKDPLQMIELNFRFVGSPGTGKTTIARRMGVLFESLGLLGTSQVVECSATDFITGYANQSGAKTRDVFNKAVGGVLFIDEAYRLNPKNGGVMMSEVVDEIVKLMTEDRFKNKMVVILAGYENEVEELLDLNPGLRSRFSQKLHFTDFNCTDACTLFRQSLRSQLGLDMNYSADCELQRLMPQVIDAPGWANGRDVENLVKKAIQAYANRNEEESVQTQAVGEDPQLLTMSDVAAAVQELLKGKRAAAPATPPRAMLGLGHNMGAVAAALPVVMTAAPPPARQPAVGVSTRSAAAQPSAAVCPATPPVIDAGAQAAQQQAIKKAVRVALEEACAELGYSLDEVEQMLSPGGWYTGELLHLVMQKSGCSQAEVVPQLDRQKPSLYKRVQALIAYREKQKTEAEVRAQQKIKQMGVCPMNYAWIKVPGGWRCAGGSHALSDDQVS